MATPLTNLIGKKAVWKWGKEEERAFQAFSGVEGQVIAIPGVDSAELQVADDLAHGRVGRGNWGYVVTEG